MLSTWSSDLNINMKNGERFDECDVDGVDDVGNDAPDDFDDPFDNGSITPEFSLKTFQNE